MYLFRYLAGWLCCFAIIGGVWPTTGHAQTWQWAVGQTVTNTSLGNAECRAVVRDASGQLVVAGEFRGTIQLGSLTLTSAGNYDVFVARLDAQGHWLQAARAGGPDYDNASGLALDAGGNAVLTGQFQSRSVDVGPFVLTNADQTYNTLDIFIARFNSQGNWVQAQRAGGIYSDYAYGGLVLDASGNAVIAGTFASPTLPLGAFTLTGVGSYPMFVARLSPQGTWMQAAIAGNAQNHGTWPTSLCLDQAGNVMVAGSFQGPATQFGTFTLTNADSAPTNANTDVFVARLSSQGTWTTAIRAGDFGTEHISGIALDLAGNLVVAGQFYGPTTTLGSTTLTNADPLAAGRSSADIFMARLSPQGSWSQVIRAGGPDPESVNGLVLDAGGNAVITGEFRNSVVQFGTFAILNNYNPASSQLVYLARLRADGQWTNALAGGTFGVHRSNAVVLDAQGQAIICGIVLTMAQFGPTTLSPPINGGLYVARTNGLPLATAAPVRHQAGLMPNPAHMTVLVTLPENTAPQSVSLLDALGRCVRSYPLPAHATSTTLDLTGLAPGCYVLRCGATSGKLVVE